MVDFVRGMGSGGGSAPVATPLSYITAPTTGDAYVAPAGFGVGSNDFIVAVWWRPSVVIGDMGNQYPVIHARTGASGNGYSFFWNYNVATMVMADGTGADMGGTFGSALYWGGEPGYPQERDALFVARVTGGAGTARLRYYLNGAQLFNNPAADPGVIAGTAPLTLAGTIAGGPMVGGIAGAAYMDGTLTDGVLSTWMLGCLEEGGVVLGAPAWDGLWSTKLTGLPGIMFPDSSLNGNDLARVGAPSSQTRDLRLA